MNILQINSSARSTGSESTRLADNIVARLRAADSSATLVRRDLASNPHPVLDEATLGALFTPADARTEAQNARIALDDALIAQVQAADVIVIGAPMVQLRHDGTVERLVRRHRPRRRDLQVHATGPVGLLNGKKSVRDPGPWRHVP